jgi:peptidoglycan/LPS O-acetylase OafA/YrhL
MNDSTTQIPEGQPDVHPANRAPADSRWRIPAVDGLRAMACLMVVVYHSWEFAGGPKLVVPLVHFDLARVVTHFSRGVDLFMVLSGFCLFLPLCKTAESIYKFSAKAFFKRRIRRIVPPYYASLVFVTLFPIALVALFHALHKPAKWQPLPTPLDIVTHLTFVHSLLPQTWKSWNSVAWSLGVEAHFYLMFPLAVLGFRRFGMKFIWWSCAVSALYLAIAGQLTLTSSEDVKMVAGLFWLARWSEFVAGMAAAWLVANYRRSGTAIAGGTGRLMICASAALLLVGMCAPTRDFINVALLSLSGAMLVIGLTASRVNSKWSFESRPMVWVGTRSYSVYLLHATILYYLGQLLKVVLHGKPMPTLVVLLTVGVVIVLVISDLFFYRFERPFLKAPAPREPAPGADRLAKQLAGSEGLP